MVVSVSGSVFDEARFRFFFMNIRFAGDLIEHSNGDEAKGEGRDRREVNN